MKKIIALLLALLMVLALTACGANSSETSTPKQTDSDMTNTTEIEESTRKYNLGETVSTNTTEFTLENAAFTIACSNSVDDDYLLPKEYDATNDSKNPFVAPIGDTLVALSFTIKNNDRTTLKVADSSAWSLYWNVIYNGEEYPLMGQDDDYALQFRYALLNENNSGWVRADTHNKYVNVGETLSVRTYGTIRTDVANLNDSFDLIIKVPSSNGLETFIYSIQKK